MPIYIYFFWKQGREMLYALSVDSKKIAILTKKTLF